MRGKMEIGGCVLIFVSVAVGEIPWTDVISRGLQIRLGGGSAGGDNNLRTVSHGSVAVLQAVNKWEEHLSSLCAMSAWPCFNM